MGDSATGMKAPSVSLLVTLAATSTSVMRNLGAAHALLPPPELAPPELAPPELAPPELAPPELAPPELAPPELAPPELAQQGLPPVV
jgi:hypothetical protein